MAGWELGAGGVDVFISYARRADGRAVAALEAALHRWGLVVWRDERTVEEFASITAGIVDGLARAKTLLAFYSTGYPSRRACQWELTAAVLAGEAEGTGGVGRRVLVVNPEPGVDHLWPVQLRDARFAAAPAVDDGAGWDRLAARVAARVAALPGPLGRVIVLAHPVWYGATGVGSTRFVGRIRDLWRVHSALSAPLVPLVSGQHGPAVAQLRGLGGIGKSLLAEEYALRFAAAYPGGVFWLRAHGSDAIGTGWTAEQRAADRLDQLAALAVARDTGVDPTDPVRVLAALRHSLAVDGRRCLWVVDDLPDKLSADEFRGWLAPHPLAATLLTTRSRRYGALATAVDLDVLSLDEGLQLLTAQRPATTGEEEEAARGLVADLGGHALALDIAGATLAASAGLQSIADYRIALADPSSDELGLAAELADALPTGHEPSITATFAHSLSRLDEAGWDFMRLASVVAAAPVPATLIAAVLSKVAGLDPTAGRQRTLRALRAVELLSLTEPTTEQDGARTVHPLLVSAVHRLDPAPDRRAQIRQAAIAALLDVLPEVADRRQHARLALAVTHARHLTRDLSGAAAQGNPLIELAEWVARHDYEAGAYTTAAQLVRLVLDARERLLGPDYPDTLRSRNNLALALQDAGRLDEALRLFRELLPDQVRLLGPDHPDTLRSCNNLAVALRAAGRLDEALPLLQRTLTGYERLLGPDHPDTLGSRNNLASALRAAGRLDEALRLLRELLPAQVRVLGPDHPNTLTSRGNLAVALHDAGRLDEALRLFRELLSAQVRVLGPDHPNTLTSRERIAALEQEVAG